MLPERCILQEYHLLLRITQLLRSVSHSVRFFGVNVPVPVAAWSKARTVWMRLDTGIVGSTRARAMDIYPRFFFVLCRV